MKRGERSHLHTIDLLTLLQLADSSDHTQPAENHHRGWNYLGAALVAEKCSHRDDGQVNHECNRAFDVVLKAVVELASRAVIQTLLFFACHLQKKEERAI